MGDRAELEQLRAELAQSAPLNLSERDELAQLRAELSPQQAQQAQPDAFRQALVDNPITATIAEAGAGLARGGTEAFDFFVSNPLRAVQQLGGTPEEDRFKTATESLSSLTTGNFMDEGLGRDVVRKGTELIAPGALGGAALRQASKAIPAIQAGAQTLGQSVTKQLGTSTAAQDVGFSALSGAGGEVGKETGIPGGELMGSFLAPVAGAGAKQSVLGLIDAGKRGIQALTKPLANISDDGAATLLAEAMVRDGLSIDDVIKRMAQLGPEAVPADIGNNFARLLRTASNKIPAIQGKAAQVIKERQAGQGDRLLGAFDESINLPNLSVSDEIARLNTVLKPQINKLYQQAGAENIQLSPRLQGLLTGESSLGKAQVKAQQSLTNRRELGENLTNVDLIDSTKRVMDDQIQTAIRQGKNNKARELVLLKNEMVKEADEAIPVYKQARDLFAGKAALENAGNSGELFLKMKPRDIRDLTKTFSESEKRIYKLGAKQAILDKIDDLQTSADATKRLFGKNGDVKKLRFLFDDEKQFKQFSDTLERESDFILTRNASQGNSSTAQQLEDADSSFETLGRVAAELSSPTGTLSFMSRVLTGLGKRKNDKDYIKALNDAGNILLVKGMKPEQIQSLLSRAQTKQIEAQLKRAIKRKNKQGFAAASIVGGASALD